MSCGFFPAWEELKRALNLRDGWPESGPVTVPADALKLLIIQALSVQHLSGDLYLKENPDIAEAAKSGTLRDPLDHFVTVGYFEGRPMPIDKIDEAFYLSHHADLRALPRDQLLAHYRASGLRELRPPSKAAEYFANRWAQLVHKAKA